MSRIILLLWGAPAGGKSSIAREIVALYRNRTGRCLPWINTDAISRAMVGDEYVAELRPAIYDGLLTMAESMLDFDLDVLLDGNYVLSSRREEVRKMAERKKVQLVNALIHCGLDSRLARNRARPQPERIPENYVKSAHEDAIEARHEEKLIIDSDAMRPVEAARIIIEAVV